MILAVSRRAPHQINRSQTDDRAADDRCTCAGMTGVAGPSADKAKEYRQSCGKPLASALGTSSTGQLVALLLHRLLLHRPLVLGGQFGHPHHSLWKGRVYLAEPTQGSRRRHWAFPLRVKHLASGSTTHQWNRLRLGSDPVHLLLGLGHLLALNLNNEVAHDMFPGITNRLLSRTSVENHYLSTTTCRAKVKHATCPLEEGSALGFA